jgi:predicted nucleic acid-binding protein
VTAESAVHFLKTNPAHVSHAAKVWDRMDDIRNIRTLKVQGISEVTFTRSLTIMQESGLLSIDALHVASREERSIDTIATCDRGFERVPEIKVWKPVKAV